MELGEVFARANLRLEVYGGRAEHPSALNTESHAATPSTGRLPCQ